MDLDRFWVGALAVGLIWIVLAVAGVIAMRHWAEDVFEEPRYVRDAREAASR